jgi:hypothetical protein
LSEAIDFFEEQKSNPSEKCKNLAKDYEKSLAWENEKVSIYSIGIVQDSEILARNIFSPIHIDEETGVLTPLAFNDVFDKGLSVIRLNYSSHDAIVSNGIEKLSNDHSQGKIDRQYLGYININANDVRIYIDSTSSRKALAIYDTAMLNLAIHADICAIIQLSKTQRTQIRHYLRENFSQLITIN